MKRKDKKAAEGNINYKKLFFELMFVLTILFVFFFAIIFPKLKEHGAFSGVDKHASLREIVEEVDNYDYNKGRDKDLESKLDKGFNDTTNTNKQYFYGVARATYYCNIGYYYTANETFEVLDQIYADEEIEDLAVREVMCQRKQGEEKYEM